MSLSSLDWIIRGVMFDCLLDNIGLRGGVVKHLPKPEKAMSVVGSCYIRKFFGRELQTHARTISAVAAPLAQQIVFFAEARYVYSLLFAGKVHEFVKVCGFGGLCCQSRHN